MSKQPSGEIPQTRYSLPSWKAYYWYYGNMKLFHSVVSMGEWKDFLKFAVFGSNNRVTSQLTPTSTLPSGHRPMPNSNCYFRKEIQLHTFMSFLKHFTHNLSLCFLRIPLVKSQLKHLGSGNSLTSRFNSTPENEIAHKNRTTV